MTTVYIYIIFVFFVWHTVHIYLIITSLRIWQTSSTRYPAHNYYVADSILQYHK